MSMREAIRKVVSVGDFVLLNNKTNRTGVVQILSGTEDTVTCRHYTAMAAEIISRYSLQPIIASLFPVTSQTNTGVEEHSAIDNVVFVVTIEELESGLVHLTGASNLYFARFGFIDEHSLCQLPSSLYFSIQLVSPFSFRLFGALNMLSQHLKRVLYFVPESCEAKKVFRIFIPTDAFHYLCQKLDNPSVVKTSMKRRQQIIKYYDTLKTESGSRENNIAYLCILTNHGLLLLCKVLGVSIGLGASGLRPSKARPVQYCTIGSLLFCIECKSELSQEVIYNPLVRLESNGIDFVYTYETQSLMCTVRFSKLPILTADVATSRIAKAYVTNEVVSAYVGACFHYEEEMYVVIAIYETLCRCKSLEDGQKTVDLHIELVNNLVNEFGSYLFFGFPLYEEAIRFPCFPQQISNKIAN